jgi:4'-phosphopantetheinyl transferase
MGGVIAPRDCPANGGSTVMDGTRLPLVEVVWADLGAAGMRLRAWQDMLSAEESARAAMFRDQHERMRYTTRRGILRALLARRLERTPSELHFCANAYGKPSLIGAEIEFNLSHAEDMVMIAMSRTVPVGCDIAFEDPRFPVEEVATRFFSPSERRELRALPETERVAAFFAGWTRKEAFVKALGLGLSLPLNSFEVSLAVDNRPPLHRGCEGWSAQSLAPADGFPAAIVARGDEWQLVASALDPLALLGDACASA